MSGLLLRLAALACLTLVLSAILPGRASADEDGADVIEQVLRFLRCTVESGPFGFMGMFCTWR
jgi:hypothetical protein